MGLSSLGGNMTDLFTGAIEAVSNLGTEIVKAIEGPSPTEEATAKATLIKAQIDATVANLQASQAVMLAEEQSSDPWTSRARPSFLYVIYLLLLFSLPMGVLFAFNPGVANGVVEGFHNWLSAIPSDLVNLFGMGYLGYTGSRTLEKHLDIKAKINGVR